MTPNLPRVSHEHHERLVHHVDRMPATGDMIGTASVTELRPRLDETCEFLTGLLIPHMDAAQRSLYPELERLFQNRHSMTPMRHEHAEMRQLVGTLVRLRDGLPERRISTGQAAALRRVVFRLYAMLKIHLAEEQLYLGVVEHGVSADVADELAAAMEHGGVPAS